MLLDVVFSLDSVITAVGMADEILIMVLAMVIAVAVMIIFANAIGDFVTEHRSMKVLALAFLILIGVTLVAEGLGQHISKGYIYFAMAFSLGVELVNLKIRGRGRKEAPAAS
jgi:predicted tellurium resistance membrane protein TerC